MEYSMETNVLLLIEASEYNPYVDIISFCCFFSLSCFFVFFCFFLGKQLVQLPELSVISALVHYCSY